MGLFRKELSEYKVMEKYRKCCMKRFSLCGLCVLLCACLLCSCASTPSATSDPSSGATAPTSTTTNKTDTRNPASDFEYIVRDTGVTIQRYIGTDTTVVIPERIENQPVTALNVDSFWLTSIEKVCLLKNIT